MKRFHHVLNAFEICKKYRKFKTACSWRETEYILNIFKKNKGIKIYE